MDVRTNIVGLTGLLEKERTFGAKVEGPLSAQLLRVGEVVAHDTRARYVEYSARGAGGVRTKVFTSGLWVVQTLLKSRDIVKRRPNFGDLMMRHAFLPAAHDNEAYVASAAEVAIEETKARYWDV